MSFNRDDRRGGGSSYGGQGGRSFGGGRGFGGGRSGGSDRPVEMHSAVCSKCGKDCEVPFKPTGAKPVFCRDCFREQGGPDRRPEGGPRNFERRDDRRDDRGPRPPAPPPHFGPPPMKKEIDELNEKLDKILSILYSTAPAKEVVKEKVVAPKKPKLPKKAVSTEESVIFEAPVETVVEESSDKAE